MKKIMAAEEMTSCYLVTYKQILEGTYAVEADSPEAALELFQKALDRGEYIAECIWNNMDIVDSGFDTVSGPEMVSDSNVDVPAERFW